MRNKKSSVGVVILVVFILIIALLAYLYNSKMFERVVPTIELSQKIDWNLKKPISVKISDESGIKFVRAILSDGKNSIVLAQEVFSVAKDEYVLDIEFPKTGFITNRKHFELSVEAVDSSKWNFFSGNKAIERSNISVDTKRPELFTINNSYKITKGGVATVIFKAEDENLQDLYIETNFGKIFKPTPFYRDGYYISLLAWPSYEESFRATIVARDRAGNVARERVRLFLQDRRYRVSKINLKDSFLDGKIFDLVQEDGIDAVNMSRTERFKHVNEVMREKNIKNIYTVTSKAPQEMISSFSLKPFHPLRNAAAVGGFGDHRHFKYNDKVISESYHLGVDLASTARADIVSSNSGVVVHSMYSGIYGKTVIISHGLGLYSLYSHNSSNLVEVGDQVKAGEVIAKTGITGLALGDHLHFGIVVQGVEVRPAEWMDRNWMRDNVFDIMDLAKRIIDKE